MLVPFFIPTLSNQRRVIDSYRVNDAALFCFLTKIEMEGGNEHGQQ